MENKVIKTQFSVPILLLIFNRPDLLKRVFEKIKKIKPAKLYVAADGPRSDYPNDKEKCDLSRQIIKEVDWPCEVFKLYRDSNLNCKNAIVPAIDWFFEHEEMGIILEDDCVPNESFFTFCQSMLEKYQNDNRIMHIAGTNLQDGHWRGSGTYFFSHHPTIAGWATWRRAWKLYDLEMKQFPLFLKQNKIKDILKNKQFIKFYLKELKRIYQNDLDEWDYGWILAMWMQNGLAIIPNINLITNIGYNLQATHTKTVDAQANLPTQEIKEIIHPDIIASDDEADWFIYKKHYSLISRIIWHWQNKIKGWLKINTIINWRSKNIIKKLELFDKSRMKMVLSPHYDDFPLSLGGMAYIWRNNQAQVEDQIVFSLTNWTEENKNDYSNNSLQQIAKISNIRYQEEMTMANILGNVEINKLGFSDASIRGLKNLVGGRKPFNLNEKEKEIINNLSFKIGELLNQPIQIFVPLAIRFHQDHFIVREATLKAISQTPNIVADIFFYEDLPYADTNKKEWQLINQFIKNNRLFKITYPINLKLKLKLIDSYPSQTDKTFYSGVTKRAVKLALKSLSPKPRERIYSWPKDGVNTLKT